MHSFTVSSVVFACVFAGALLGLFLRAALPQHHLGADSKDVVKVGMGLIASMTALLLGLLVASAKSSCDTGKAEITPMSARIIFLDHATVVATLFFCALCVSGAIFLILELDHPFDGLLQIWSAPMRVALQPLGQ